MSPTCLPEGNLLTSASLSPQQTLARSKWLLKVMEVSKHVTIKKSCFFILEVVKAK